MNRPSSELSELGQTIALGLGVVSLYLHVHVGNFNFIRFFVFFRSLELSVLVKAIALVLTGCMYVTRGNILHYSPLVALGKPVERNRTERKRKREVFLTCTVYVQYFQHLQTRTQAKN